MIDMSDVSVLFIEDDESSIKITLELLTRSKDTKFSVDIATTLNEGIEKLKANHIYDVVLLDLVLPNGSGVNVFREVKKVTNLPIIITSGYEDKAIECVKLGAQDYIVKPYNDVNILSRSIRYAIERNRAENMYKDIIRSSPLGYHIYRLQNDKLIFVDYNSAAEKILKFDHSEYLYESINVPFPSLSDELKNLYIEILKTGSTFTDLLTEYEDDKIEKGYFRISGHRTKSNELAVTFEDVTESVRTQNELRKSRKKYKQVVDGTHAAVYEIDFLQNKFTYINDFALQETGYTREEMLNMSPVDFLTDESTKVWLNRLEKIQSGMDIDNVEEYQIKRKDGSLMWILVTAEYRYDENGFIIGASVIALDITEKKMKENLIQSIYKTAPVAIGLLTNDRTLIDVNDRFCEMMGYEKDEVLDRNVEFIYPDKKEYERVGKIKYSLIEKKGIGIVETKFRKKDGDLIDILLTTARLDVNDPSKGVTFSALDITKSKEMEREIESELNKRLDEWQSEIGISFQNLNRLESIMSL